MRIVPALVSSFLLLALAGCEPPPSIPDARLAAWEQAFNAGDGAAVAALYTEDATLMPPGVPAMKGREAIEKFMQEGFAQGPARIALGQDELFTMGDAAVRRGTYKVTGADGVELEAGKYVEVWRRVQDDWLICIDIWNANAAPPAPPPAPSEAPAPTPG